MNTIAATRSRTRGVAVGLSSEAAATAAEQDSGGDVPLSMYSDPPKTELSLHDFEVCALDRLKVLKGVESARSRGMKGEELASTLRELVRKHLSSKGERSRGGRGSASRKDEVSHHILRLAYCGTEDKRRWFVQQETALFRWRLEQLYPEQVAEFMSHHGLNYEVCSDSERGALRSSLQKAALAAARGKDGVEAGIEAARGVHYKVPFIEALEHVRTRRVLVHKGKAYVPGAAMAAIVVGRFRSRLARALAYAARALPGVLQDERLGPVLGNMSRAYLGADWSAQNVSEGDRLRPAEIDGPARASMPLCMRTLVDHLGREHKLKHGGRLQLGLFLKGAGLGMEESIEWWKSHFTKRMSGEEFIKSYVYNIRHLYGKEGKRTDYTPFSCHKIIMGEAPGGDKDNQVGCPFRHWGERNLREYLVRQALPPSAVDDIVGSVRTRDFQVACRKEFTARHGSLPEDVGDHPNTYFAESRKLRAEKAQQQQSSSSAAAAATTSEPKFQTASSPTTVAAAAATAAADEE